MGSYSETYESPSFIQTTCNRYMDDYESFSSNRQKKYIPTRQQHAPSHVLYEPPTPISPMSVPPVPACNCQPLLQYIKIILLFSIAYMLAIHIRHQQYHHKSNYEVVMVNVPMQVAPPTVAPMPVVPMPVTPPTVAA